MREIEISYQLCVFWISKISNTHEFNCIWLRTKQFLRSINVCMYVYLRFGTPSHPFSLYINMFFAECYHCESVPCRGIKTRTKERAFSARWNVFKTPVTTRNCKQQVAGGYGMLRVGCVLLGGPMHWSFKWTPNNTSYIDGIWVRLTNSFQCHTNHFNRRNS